MIVVAHNSDTTKKDDDFLQKATTAENALAVGSVRGLAEAIAKYADNSIDVLIIADHGAEGIQGLGSGTGSDFGAPKNLSATHIRIPTEKGLGEPKEGKLFISKLIDGSKLKNYFTDPAQVGYLRTISMKLRSNANGLVLLHGCEVGSGEDGAQLVRSLSLTIQNSVSVMACRHKTRWINDNEKVKFGRTWLNKFWPALHSPNRRLQGGDMIGYMGVQPLGQTQMQNLLDTTCITPKAPVQPQNNAKK